MDAQFWIYLVIAIIYMISRALKKTDNQSKETEKPKPERRANYDTQTERPKQLTFEELLREITEAKQPKRPVYETVEPKQEYVDYDDQIGEEEQNLEEERYDYRKKDKIYETYEEAKRVAFERPSLEETMKVQNTNTDFGKFKEFELKKQPNVVKKYVKDLEDPEAWKKAVIMSEILNRKFQY